MMIDFADFYSKLPLSVRGFLRLCDENSIIASFIGGVTRDYIHKKIISSDIDICLRSSTSLDHLLAFISKLKKYYRVEEKKYGVFVLDDEIEVSLPRKEIFIDEISHSNFKAEFINDLNFKEDVLRRDFTINAISCSYYKKKFHLNDPLNGVDDINKRQLRACSEHDFSKDPVRFLRAIRFHLLLDFSFESFVEDSLRTMKLNFSSFYIKNEALKSQRLLSFFVLMFYYREELSPISLSKVEISDIFAYEDSIKSIDIKSHLQAALFLNKDYRKHILNLCGLKCENIYYFNTQQFDLAKIVNMSLENIQKSNEIKELMYFLDFAWKLNDQYLQYIIDLYKIKTEVNFFNEYKKLKIEVSKEILPKFRSAYIFQEKLKRLL